MRVRELGAASDSAALECTSGSVAASQDLKF